MADVTIPLGPFNEEDLTTLSVYFCTEVPIEQEQKVTDDEPVFDGKGLPVMIDKYTPIEWLALFAAGCIKRKAEKGAVKIKLSDEPVDQELINRMMSNFLRS